MSLPHMRYTDRITAAEQMHFGGLNCNLSASDGEIQEMENLTGDFAPLLKPRKKRYRCAVIQKPNGLFSSESLYWVDGTGLYRDGTKVSEVTDCKKQFTAMGGRLIIFPDKVIFNEQTGKTEPMEAVWTGAAVIKDGTYAGVPAKANTISATGADRVFAPGDAVEISGAAVHPENQKTAIIREVEKDTLRFSENTFVINGDESEQLTIKRAVPDLDFICTRENRLFGCKDDTIYVSAWGNPKNFQVFDGLDTDSFTVSAGSPGKFTGCVSYRGYCIFMKENQIFKLYGDLPRNYQLLDSASLGVEKSSAASLAIAGETLFYLSSTGVVSYSGGFPQSVHKPLGTDRMEDAVGGTDGLKYYLSAKNNAGGYDLFTFDTSRGLWHRQDSTRALGFTFHRQNLYMMTEESILVVEYDQPPAGLDPEPDFISRARFAAFTDITANKKGYSKFLLRMELDDNAWVEVKVMFDSDGVWHSLGQIHGLRKQMYLLPIIPRRCDHMQLEITGQGDYTIYDLVRRRYKGSYL